MFKEGGLRVPEGLFSHFVQPGQSIWLEREDALDVQFEWVRKRNGSSNGSSYDTSVIGTSTPPIRVSTRGKRRTDPRSRGLVTELGNRESTVSIPSGARIHRDKERQTSPPSGDDSESSRDSHDSVKEVLNVLEDYPTMGDFPDADELQDLFGGQSLEDRTLAAASGVDELLQAWTNVDSTGKDTEGK